MPESIHVRGLVQGVGFRPFVWHLAQRFGIRGRVWNDGDSVRIQAWGEMAALRDFRQQICINPPPLARIDALEHTPLTDADMPEAFVIVDSRPGPAGTAVTPDAAVCPDCLHDVLNSADRHYGYPLTSCSHCGPRLSIVRAMPYDRQRTSMADFAMCPDCRAEYENPAARRFHAQANACPVCGPSTWLEDGEGRRLGGENGEAVIEAARLIREGKIVAIKGIGGIHLAVDAGNGEAVSRLRVRKHRDAKPLALMARDIEMVEAYARVDKTERQLLMGSEAPIVLLAKHTDGKCLADGVAPGHNRLGFMLPYTPLHALLMREMARPIVLTSGNHSDTPQCIDNDEARRHLTGIADAWLLHDRQIVNRLDDSVVTVAAGRPRLLRRARGYAPAPLLLPGFEAAPTVLAMGGELKHTFCLLSDGQAVLSQHMGDLEHAEAFRDCRKNLELYQALFGFRPRAVATDLHPDYLSGGLGREQAAAEGVPLIAVQHHHAHIAACMAEHCLPLDSSPVLGIALDGLGYGTDGTLWGGEFLEAGYAGFKRRACFRPVAMPGGSQAVHEPWRNAFAHLQSLGWERVQRESGDIDIVRFLEDRPIQVLRTMVEKGLNSPPASSCGRLFDAVAAVLGVCRERISYEGQAAIELEALAMDDSGDDGIYPFRLEAAGEGLLHLGWETMWPALLDDIQKGTARAIIAARFHRTVSAAVSETALSLCRERQLATVALGGGSFQNRLLLEGVVASLRQAGLQVLVPERVPANDGGLSLGQAAVAAARLLQDG